MKKLLFSILFGTLLLSAATYRAEEAGVHIGEYATVCGTVFGGYYAKRSRGRPTFLNLDGNYPHQPFTVVIWGKNRRRFHAPEKRLLGKHICVTGTIGIYRGIPQIVLSDPSRLH